MWYDYDNHYVTRSTFSKIFQGVRTAKANFQRKAGLRSPTQDNTGIFTSRAVGNNDNSTNSSDVSRASKFSAVGNDDDNNHSKTQNDNDQDDDHHIERNMTTGLDQRKVDSSNSDDDASLYHSVDGSDEEVRVSIISAPIKLSHAMHFNILVFVFSSCYSRILNIRDRRALGVWRLE